MKIRWKEKIKSGALQFTLFISVLIALLLAAIVLLAYTHRYFIEQSKAIVNNIQLSETGIIMLQKHETLSNDTLLPVLKDVREDQSIKIHLSQWGIFEKGFVQTIHRKKVFTKCVLLGSGINKEDRPSIYLTENYNPLAVVGNTVVKGKAFLPQQGIRPGNISGNSYYGSRLMYGIMDKSDNKLPELKYDYKRKLRQLLKEYEPLNMQDYIPLGKKSIITNSFKEATKGYYSTSEVVLENTTIRGNIIIRSSQKIIVRATANLGDIILLAPEIIIDDGVSGNFQAIADKSIRVGQHCRLSYPTALVLLENENQVSPPSRQNDIYSNTIFINKGALVKGTICYFDEVLQQRDFKANICFSEKSELTGEIYCDGNLELKDSSVFGTVYTNYFISNEGGTVFVNHLYNCEINSEKLPEAFGGILFERQNKNVMQWLY